MENKTNKIVKDVKKPIKRQLPNMDVYKRKLKGGRELVYPFMFDCNGNTVIKGE